MSTLSFVNKYFAGYKKNQHSQTGIIMFCNKEPIYWYSKKYATVDFITFASELITMSMNAEMTNALRYKIFVSEVPKKWTSKIFYNEMILKNTVMKHPILKNKQHSIAYQIFREAVDAEIFKFLRKVPRPNFLTCLLRHWCKKYGITFWTVVLSFAKVAQSYGFVLGEDYMRFSKAPLTREK